MSVATRARGHLSDRMEYRVYFAVLFPFFLVGSLFSHLFARTLAVRYVDDRPREHSVVNETIAALNCALPWVYMGR